MRVHATVLERPSSVVGHLPAPSQLVHGTRDVATRAAGRAADLAQPLHDIHVGQVAHTATGYARRRPTESLAVLACVAFALGFAIGRWTKTLQHHTVDVAAARGDRPPDAVVERGSDPASGENA